MKSLVLALQFMTRLPLPRVEASAQEFAAAIRWFPAAGLVVGAAVAVAALAGGQVDAWTGALLALLAWVWMTGALHLDGLGDIADAAGAGHADRARVSQVLADPHIGSFGAVAIGLQIAAKLVLLHGVLEQGSVWPLLLVPVVARIAPLAWALSLPPLHEGLGTRFRASARWWHVAAWSALAACAVPFAPGLAPSLGVALVAVPLWALWLRARIGGISGDGHGAGIELVETVLLFSLVVSS